MRQAMIGFVVGAASASALWWWFGEPDDARAAGGAPTESISVHDFAEVVRAELTHLLPLVKTGSTESPSAVRVQESDENEPEVASRLEAVEQALLRLEARLDDVGVGEEAPPSRRPVNDGAVASTVMRYRADSKGTLDHFFMWTPSMVYRTHGKPDSSYTSGAQTVTWEYFATSEGGLGIRFNFVAGIVQGVRLSERVRDR